MKLKAVENLFFWGKQFKLDLQGEKCNTHAPCCVLASHIYQKSPVQLWLAFLCANKAFFFCVNSLKSRRKSHANAFIKKILFSSKPSSGYLCLYSLGTCDLQINLVSFLGSEIFQIKPYRLHRIPDILEIKWVNSADTHRKLDE